MKILLVTFTHVAKKAMFNAVPPIQGGVLHKDTVMSNIALVRNVFLVDIFDLNR